MRIISPLGLLYCGIVDLPNKGSSILPCRWLSLSRRLVYTKKNHILYRGCPALYWRFLLLKGFELYFLNRDGSSIREMWQQPCHFNSLLQEYDYVGGILQGNGGWAQLQVSKVFVWDIKRCQQFNECTQVLTRNCLLIITLKTVFTLLFMGSYTHFTTCDFRILIIAATMGESCQISSCTMLILGPCPPHSR